MTRGQEEVRGGLYQEYKRIYWNLRVLSTHVVRCIKRAFWFPAIEIWRWVLDPPHTANTRGLGTSARACTHEGEHHPCPQVWLSAQSCADREGRELCGSQWHSVQTVHSSLWDGQLCSSVVQGLTVGSHALYVCAVWSCSKVWDVWEPTLQGISNHSHAIGSVFWGKLQIRTWSHARRLHTCPQAQAWVFLFAQLITGLSASMKDSWALLRPRGASGH